MGVKADAGNILKRNLRKRQEEAVAQREQRADQQLHRLQALLKKLLSGKQMSAKDGREFFYEFICNNAAFRKDVFTGNSETYKRIGEQEWARDLMEFAKLTDIGLYHRMELEAIEREKRGQVDG